MPKNKRSNGNKVPTARQMKAHADTYGRQARAREKEFCRRVMR